MVVPLLNFPIKGTVWYQGEANSGSVPEAEECTWAVDGASQRPHGRF